MVYRRRKKNESNDIVTESRQFKPFGISNEDLSSSSQCGIMTENWQYVYFRVSTKQEKSDSIPLHIPIKFDCYTWRMNLDDYGMRGQFAAKRLFSNTRRTAWGWGLRTKQLNPLPCRRAISVLAIHKTQGDSRHREVDTLVTQIAQTAAITKKVTNISNPKRLKEMIDRIQFVVVIVEI